MSDYKVHSASGKGRTFSNTPLASAICEAQRLPRRVTRRQDAKRVEGLMKLNHLVARANEALEEEKEAA